MTTSIAIASPGQAVPQPPTPPPAQGPLTPREVQEMTRDLANGVRESRAAQAQVEAAMRAADAQVAAEQAGTVAGQAGQAGQAEAATPAPGVTTVIGEDGTVRRYENGQPVAVEGGTTIAVPPNGAAEIAREVKEGVGIVGGMLLGALTIWLFFRTIQRWIAARGATAALPRDAMDRLARIENAIEAMAVEVERISEGQRFTTRLLSEKSPVERAG